MTGPPLIDHIPNEKRPPWWLWWAVFGMLACLWLLQIDREVDWATVMLGIGTGVLVTAWSMEITGGEVPASWRSKSRRD